MTFPSASRPDDRAADQAQASGTGTGQDAPPVEAVSLADLIADSGPLPPDAALECVQRLAERLTRRAPPASGSLSPSNVLIDDDGEVWLRDSSGDEPLSRGAIELTADMDRLGRLLAFLSTGDGGHLDAGSIVDVATLPPPLPTVAGRLFSSNGSCYRSYAELAREAALLRGLQVEPASLAQQTAVIETPSEAISFEPPVGVPQQSIEPLPIHAESIEVDRLEAPTESSEPEAGDRNWVGVAVLVLLVLAALAAYAVWG